MFPKNRTALSSLLVLMFGIVLFYIGTDGFKAFTAETARVNQLMDEKPQFPDVTLEDNNGKSYSFSEFEGKYVFITFLYTSCGTVCPELEVNMSEVYKRIPEEYIGHDIQFLSISFDPERDDPKTLDTYRKAFGSDGETWRMARIPEQQELDSVLDRFGVIVIPDEYGNFAHNSAFYLVNPKGQLIEVMDYTLIEEAADRVTEILHSGREE
ncbi:electron transporter SenC [Cytobacillus firmus]|uniref:Cytochrome oxidase biogenesis protein Sco1 n=2 Tax=Bacillaceae TaxID=186817 RepID=A0A380XC80_CYTFI|nr:SCO family protein [Cytobacillus firmus]KAF0821569.1 Cytochrome oxidase biogenesis protein Sco1 [Cytobacillus firmus]MBG9543755.1 electron transporter SenC [Cytobacillus firmus]MBG9553092.1 electron transporter SenC [Cytobacillus firmus]MBG9555889.1 electron transporter SenC [Cytobacillus firmus]MBG9574883.1 electron transporter SenC [Cytobacillus firmus]